MRYYVTGVPGIGKSTIMQQLINKGYTAFDLDYIPGVCEWVNKETKKPVEFLHGSDAAWHKAHGWFANIEKLEKFLKTQKDNVFVCGISENQDDFLALFDTVFLLHADESIFLNRMAGRDANHFGYNENDRNTVLSWYKEFEKRLLAKGAITVDASRPLDLIVRDLLMHVKSPMITVSYKLEKEFDNLQRGLKTQHNPEHQPRLVREMLEAKVELQDRKQVKNFIAEKIRNENISIEEWVSDIQGRWNDIAESVLRRMDTLFDTHCPFESITVYLTLNGRCSYNFSERYFFVCLTRANPIGIMIHELLHFYTHLLIQPLFKERGLEEKLPEFKEALTVLLNKEFVYIIEEPDKGYEKHEKSRQWIMDNWKAGMTIQGLTQLYLGEQ